MSLNGAEMLRMLHCALLFSYWHNNHFKIWINIAGEHKYFSDLTAIQQGSYNLGAY